MAQETLTSNPCVHRAELERFVKMAALGMGVPCLYCEIERLTRERDERMLEAGRATVLASEFADERDRLTAELAETQKLAESLQNKWATRPLDHPSGDALMAENDRLRAALERAGQRLTSLAKRARCRCQATSGYTHPCEACRALKHAEDIAVMLRGDVPALAGAADEPKAAHVHRWQPVGDRCGPMVEHVCECGAGYYDPTENGEGSRG